MNKNIKDSLPYWVVCACMNCARNKFYKISNKNFDDAFMSAYLGIVEGLKNDSAFIGIDLDDVNALSKEQYITLLHYGGMGLRRYYFQKRYDCPVSICSIDKPLKDEKRSKTFGETIVSENTYNLDYNLIVELLQKELSKYNLKEREVLSAYFEGITKQDIMKKFRLSFEELGVLVCNFRSKFNNVLFENEVFDSPLLLDNREFSSYQEYQDGERRKELAKGLVLGRDIKLIKLVKTLPMNELSEFLGVSLDNLTDIIEHRKGSSKFWLYQVQQIRKKYFPTYSFEELFEVV